MRYAAEASEVSGRMKERLLPRVRPPPGQKRKRAPGGQARGAYPQTIDSTPRGKADISATQPPSCDRVRLQRGAEYLHLRGARGTVEILSEIAADHRGAVVDVDTTAWRPRTRLAAIERHVATLEPFELRDASLPATFVVAEIRLVLA
jgi:hypothetical protein